MYLYNNYINCNMNMVNLYILNIYMLLTLESYIVFAAGNLIGIARLKTIS